MTWMMLMAVGAPIVGAAGIAGLKSGRTDDAQFRARRIAVWTSALTLAASIAVLVEATRSGRIDLVVESDDGRALLGLTAAHVEASLLVLTAFVGLVVQSFASRSLVGDARAVRFHGLALGLVATTNLVAVAASGITLIAGWVATSLVVTALVGHRRGWSPAAGAVRTTRAAFAIGDLALLAAVVLVTASAGHLDLRSVGDATDAIDGDGLVTLAAILLVVAGVARSALIPLGTWLPTTLAAPTPVSALLHAGVVNGAGVLLIRFHPLVTESAAALAVAYVAGVVTAVVATAVMIVRTDVKGSLVWSTAGQMGFMVAQLGAGAFAAAFFHLIGHAMYKAAAFLGAGDAIGARARRTVRPGRHATVTVPSALLSLAIGALSVGAALFVLDPHLTDAGTVLVATFATLTLARAVHGWVVTTALAATVVIPSALLGAATAAFAYVAGLKLIEGFVVDEVPFELATAVGAPWVIGTIVAVGLGALAITRAPGARADDVRRGLYAWLVTFGSATSPIDGRSAAPQRAEPEPPSPSSTPLLVGSETADAVPSDPTTARTPS